MSGIPKITIVGCEAGDWEAVYLDGKLAVEGHYVRHVDLLEVLGLPYTRETIMTGVDGWAEFPKLLADAALKEGV